MDRLPHLSDHLTDHLDQESGHLILLGGVSLGSPQEGPGGSFDSGPDQVGGDGVARFPNPKASGSGNLASDGVANQLDVDLSLWPESLSSFALQTRWQGRRLNNIGLSRR